MEMARFTLALLGLVRRPNAAVPGAARGGHYAPPTGGTRRPPGPGRHRHRRPGRPVWLTRRYLEEAGLIAGDAVHVLGAESAIPIGGVGPAGADGAEADREPGQGSRRGHRLAGLRATALRGPAGKRAVQAVLPCRPTPRAAPIGKPRLSCQSSSGTRGVRTMDWGRTRRAGRTRGTSPHPSRHRRGPHGRSHA